MIGANMQCELLVALQLEVAHHFIERCAAGCTRGFEPPGTFGTTKTPKTRLLEPYQLPAHGRLCRCAPTSTRLLSRDETFWFAINGSLSQRAYCLIAAENRYPVRAWRKVRKGTKFTCANLEGLSGTLHMEDYCLCERPISAVTNTFAASHQLVLRGGFA